MADAKNRKLRTLFKTFFSEALPEEAQASAPVNEHYSDERSWIQPPSLRPAEFSEEDTAPAPDDGEISDLFDIRIDYDATNESMDFTQLDTYIKTKPADSLAEPAEAVDLSISFDEDETDMLPQGERDATDSEITLDNFDLDRLGIEFDGTDSSEQTQTEAEEPAYEQPEEDESSEPEQEELQEESYSEEDYDIDLEELGISFEELDAYSEPEAEVTESEYEKAEYEKAEYEEPEYEEAEYEEAKYEEPEYEEPEYKEPEYDELLDGDYSKEDLDYALSQLGISFDGLDIYDEPETESEAPEYEEAVPEYKEETEPEAEPSEAKGDEAELTYEDLESDSDFDIDFESLGISFDEPEEEIEPAESEEPARETVADDFAIYDHAAAYDKYSDEDIDFSRLGINFEAYHEPDPEHETVAYTSNVAADAHDEYKGLSTREAEALRYAKQIRERGFDFDAVFDDETNAEAAAEIEEIDLAGEGLFEEFDSRFDMSRPTMGVTYGIEQEDKGLGTEEYVKPVTEPESVGEKKTSRLASLLSRFGGGRAKPVQESAEETTEPEDDDVKVYRAGKLEPAPDNRAEPDVKMAEGFSNEEMAAAYAASLSDSELDDAQYAADRDYAEESYDYDDPDGDDFEDDIEIDDAFPSFKEFVISDIMGLVYKLSGKGRRTTSTAAEDGEKLGPEAKPADAMRHYARFIRPLQMRLRIAAGVMFVMLWISLELPVPGMLKSVPTAAAALLALQLCMLLLALDVLTNAVLNAAQGKLGADALAVIACLATSFDALLVAKNVTSAHLPLCVVSSAAIFGVLFASMLAAKSLRKTFRVPTIGRKAYVVTAETELTGKDNITALKSESGIKGFVRCAEQAAPDEWLYLRYGPYILIAIAVISIVVTALTKNLSNFVYVFSALLAPTVPFAALVSFALPFFISAIQIFSSGAAIAGWSGVSDIGRSKDIIITDRDLFPDENVKIKEVRIFSDVDERRFIACAGTMIMASGSCLKSAIMSYMDENNISPRPVEGYEYLPGGGLKGVIDGEVVLLGNADMMRLMHIAVKNSLVKPNTIVVAINNCLYGFIDVEYTPDNTVRAALMRLMASNRHPVFAIRDFNITPKMISEVYDVATDGYDFPSYIERFRLSSASPEKKEQPAAVVCRGGLAPLINTVNAGRSVYVTVKLNIIITVIAAVLGVVLAAVQLVGTGSVSPAFFTMFEIICALPVMLLSVFMKL